MLYMLLSSKCMGWSPFAPSTAISTESAVCGGSSPIKIGGPARSRVVAHAHARNCRHDGLGFYLENLWNQPQSVVRSASPPRRQFGIYRYVDMSAHNAARPVISRG